MNESEIGFEAVEPELTPAEPVAVIEEPTPELAPEPAVEPVVEPEPVVEVEPTPVAKSKYREPKSVTMDDILNSVPEPAGPAVVSNNSVDDVVLASAVYKNVKARKSLTIHHLQRRLVELGYERAGLDKDGWYGENTLSAIVSYQKDKGVGESGRLDAETFLAIFKNDPNVKPIV
jgi:hypothetical protein